MEPYVITISRQFASMGRTIAQQMSKELGIDFYDRDIVELTAKRLGEPVSVISDSEENAKGGFFVRQYPLGMVASMKDEIFQVQSNIIQDLANKESCIIVGRCSNYVLREKKNIFRIYIYAPYEERLKNCTERLGMDEKTARTMIHNVDLARERYHRHYCREADSIFDYQDLFIDSSRLGPEKTAELLCGIVKNLPFYPKNETKA